MLVGKGLKTGRGRVRIPETDSTRPGTVLRGSREWAQAYFVFLEISIRLNMRLIYVAAGQIYQHSGTEAINIGVKKKKKPHGGYNKTERPNIIIRVHEWPSHRHYLSARSCKNTIYYASASDRVVVPSSVLRPCTGAHAVKVAVLLREVRVQLLLYKTACVPGISEYIILIVSNTTMSNFSISPTT